MMRRRSLLPFLAALSLAPFAGCGGDPTTPGTGGASASSSSSGGGGDGDLTPFYSPPPDSCAYDCPMLVKCPEQTAPYGCPSLGDWTSIPHAAECGGWDGKYPAVTAGKCAASAPAGDALKRAGVDP